MAVLEAFIYDPLLDWRLVDGKSKLRTKTKQTTSRPDSTIASHDATNLMTQQAQLEQQAYETQRNAEAGAAKGGVAGATTSAAVAAAGTHASSKSQLSHQHNQSNSNHHSQHNHQHSPASPSGQNNFIAGGDDGHQSETMNTKALFVVNRVRDKLTGKDFDPNVTFDVPNQIDLLIKQATSNEKLCQCYIGWCPFW